MKLAYLVLFVYALASCRSSSHQTFDDQTPTASSAIFASEEPIELTIEAPFSDIFYLAKMGIRDRPGRPVRRVKDYKPGILKGKTASGEDFELKMKIKVRGNSSLSDCSFGKLKIKFAKEVAQGTLFAMANEIKIGSHCENDFSKEQPYTMAGRYLDPIATHREAFAYSLFNLLGLPSPKSRPAVIRYVDTSEDSWGEPIKRKAFLFEDIEVVADNMGGLKIRDEDLLFSPDEVDLVDKDITLKLYFAEAMIGNWDWNLTLDKEQIVSEPETTEVGARRKHLWNMDILTAADGKTIPVPGDFDLATVVNDFLRMGMVADDFLPGEKNTIRFRANILQRSTKYFSPESLKEMKAFFEDQKRAVLGHIENTPMDNGEKERLREHVDQFYRALSVLNF